MPNYQEGKIYCIRSRDSDDVYIGSTTQPLARRFASHKNTAKNGSGITSSSIVCSPSAYIELIEAFPCDTGEQLKRREGELIASMDCVNKVIAGRTKQEYRDLHREKQKEYMKNYYAENKETLAVKQKEYADGRKEVKSQYDKEYIARNRDAISQKKKEYYQANQERLRAYQVQRRQMLYGANFSGACIY